MIGALFPNEVVTVTGPSALADGGLFPEEEACVRRAVPKRRREYAAGRALAHQALARLGISQFPLVTGTDRAPVWPDGVVGSVTHCEGFCGVAVAREGEIRGVGLDAEPANALPANLVPLVCTPGEIAWARRAPRFLADWFTLTFSAKESVFKCWYAVTRRWLDFLDVCLAIDAQAASFTVAFLRGQEKMLPDGWVLAGRFTVEDRRVLTAVTLSVSPFCRPQ